MRSPVSPPTVSEPISRVRAFTLIELLTVLGLITTLAALALMVVPAALERDRVVDAATQVQSMLQIAQARAMRDNRPHGVRLIIDNTQPNPLFVTSLQYIEAPPILLPNPDPVIQPTAPYVRFLYSYANDGTINNRKCQIVNVPSTLLTASGARLLLILPVLGCWLDVSAVSSVSPNILELTLRHYPDDLLGAAGPPAGTATSDAEIYRTYHFGLLRAPQPLLGEPVVQLPTKTCIDLMPGLSEPNGSTVPPGGDYDILFIPSGQLSPYSVSGGAGHVFLWIRDPNKPEGSGRMDPVYYGGVTTPAFQDALRRGGEQMIVAVKAYTGAIGVAPVNWPDGTNNDLHWFARQAVSNP
jgi:Tfp pilus assembly protein FimT